MATETRGIGPTESAAAVTALVVASGPNVIQRTNRRIVRGVSWLWKPVWKGDKYNNGDGPPGIVVVLTFPIWLPILGLYWLFASEEGCLGLAAKLGRLLFGPGKW